MRPRWIASLRFEPSDPAPDNTTGGGGFTLPGIGAGEIRTAASVPGSSVTATN